MVNGPQINQDLEECLKGLPEEERADVLEHIQKTTEAADTDNKPPATPAAPPPPVPATQTTPSRP